MRGVIQLLLIGLVVSCASASGDVRGGETRFDAAAPDVPITEDPFTDASPTSWRGIYRDFFGRRAKASCAGTGNCHGAESKRGATISHFVCGDVDGCYTSLRIAKDSRPSVSMFALVEDKDIASPDGAYLFNVIRYRNAEDILLPNRMPQAPAGYAYSADEIDRMKAWIMAGAKND